MTANPAPDPSPARDPLHPAVATPKAIRAALLPETRTEFDWAYEAALQQARAELDLTALHETVESWRRRAALERNPADFKRLVRRAAELLTGTPVPDDEPLSVTRAKVGM